MSNWKWKDVPTRRIEVGGVSFAYRELGPCSGVPVIFLHHLMAVLDDWDPRVIDGIAAQRRCLGRFGAKNRRMRQDAITFIRAFARRDHDLVLIARGKSRLDDLAARLHAECNVAVDVLPADLTNRTDLSALETRLREDPRIGILINNAGMPQASGFVEQTNENIERLITLNTTALTRLAAAIAPRFAQSGSGAIVNIGSVVSFEPEFGMSIYGATKAFVLFLPQGLDFELAPKGVYVQAVLPAATRTEIWERADMDSLATLTIIFRMSYEQGEVEWAWLYAESIFRVLLLMWPFLDHWSIADQVFEIFVQRVFRLMSFQGKRMDLETYDYLAMAQLLHKLSVKIQEQLEPKRERKLPTFYALQTLNGNRAQRFHQYFQVPVAMDGATK